ncbi:hypothetical protein Q1695_008691 [Nippostrongylus brasiliensis]|nr:hypothetical protein Q1695_008691 [Nippostrongylus brasiliensis]
MLQNILSSKGLLGKDNKKAKGKYSSQRHSPTEEYGDLELQYAIALEKKWKSEAKKDLDSIYKNALKEKLKSFSPQRKSSGADKLSRKDLELCYANALERKWKKEAKRDLDSIYARALKQKLSTFTPQNTEKTPATSKAHPVRFRLHRRTVIEEPLGPCGSYTGIRKGCALTCPEMQTVPQNNTENIEQNEKTVTIMHAKNVFIGGYDRGDHVPRSPFRFSVGRRPLRFESPGKPRGYWLRSFTPNAEPSLRAARTRSCPRNLHQSQRIESDLRTAVSLSRSVHREGEYKIVNGEMLASPSTDPRLHTPESDRRRFGAVRFQQGDKVRAVPRSRSSSVDLRTARAHSRDRREEIAVLNGTLEVKNPGSFQNKLTIQAELLGKQLTMLTLNGRRCR